MLRAAAILRAGKKKARCSKRGVLPVRAATPREAKKSTPADHGGMFPRLPLPLQRSVVPYLDEDAALCVGSVSQGGRQLSRHYFEKLSSFDNWPREAMVPGLRHCIQLRSLRLDPLLSDGQLAALRAAAGLAPDAELADHLIERNARTLTELQGPVGPATLALLAKCPQLTAVDVRWSDHQNKLDFVGRQLEREPVARPSAGEMIAGLRVILESCPAVEKVELPCSPDGAASGSAVRDLIQCKYREWHTFGTNVAFVQCDRSGRSICAIVGQSMRGRLRVARHSAA